MKKLIVLFAFIIACGDNTPDVQPDAGVVVDAMVDASPLCQPTPYTVCAAMFDAADVWCTRSVVCYADIEGLPPYDQCFVDYVTSACEWRDCSASVSFEVLDEFYMCLAGHESAPCITLGPLPSCVLP